MLFAYIYVFSYPSLWYIYYLTDINYETRKFSPHCLWYSLSVCVLSCVLHFAIPWTVARCAPLSMEFSRQEYWSRLPFPTPGDLLHPGVKSTSSALQQADSLPLSHKRKKDSTGINILIHTFLIQNITSVLISLYSHQSWVALIYLFGSLCLLIYLFIKSVTDLIGDILLNEINPEYSLEGLMLKLKLQNFDPPMQRANSLEKTLITGKIESRRRGGEGG